MAPTPPTVGAPSPVTTPKAAAKTSGTLPVITDIKTRDAELRKWRPLSLRRTNDAADVKKVQELLHQKLPGFVAKNPGVMDKETVAAIKAVQSMANHEPGKGFVREDGIVGQQTYALLLGTPKELLPRPGVELLDYSHWHPDESVQDVDKVTNYASLRGGTGDNEKLRSFAMNYISSHPELRITSTTGGEHAIHSRHYLGEAIDVGGPPASLDAFYKAIQDKEKELGVNAHELIYSPEGFEKEGQKVSLTGALKQEHFNHVHYSWNV